MHLNIIYSGVDIFEMSEEALIGIYTRKIQTYIIHSF